MNASMQPAATSAFAPAANDGVVRTRSARLRQMLLSESGARIEVLYVQGHWRAVNDLDDFRQAVDFAHTQTPFGSTQDNGSAAPHD